MGRALRVFYRKLDSKIVWYHETRSPEGKLAICPTTIEEDLSNIPNLKLDGKIVLGGIPEDYSCIKAKSEDLAAYFASDENRVVNDKLITGSKRVVLPKPEPELVRDLVAEIDELKAKLKQAGIG